MAFAVAWPLLQPPASAQQLPSAASRVPLPTWFTEIDTAGSGVVTREQFIAYRMKLFDQFDTNKDGVLTKDEFLKLAEPALTPHSPPLADRKAFYEKQFEAIDTDFDDKLTRAEVQADLELGFREFDIDNDGRITQEEARSTGSLCAWRFRLSLSPDVNADCVVDLEEFVAFEIGRFLVLDENRDGNISRQEWLKLAGDPNHNPPGQANHQQRLRALTKRFPEIDANKDGQLDQAEMRATVVALFKRFDLDGSGKITLREWQGDFAPRPRPQGPK